MKFSSRALESVRREMKLALKKRSFRGEKWIWTRIEVEFDVKEVKFDAVEEEFAGAKRSLAGEK